MSGPSIGRRTVTVNAHVLVWPQPSLAVASTVLVVLGRNAVPDGGVDATVTGLQASVARIVQVATALAPQVVRTMLLGQTIVGVTPTTATAWLQVERTPLQLLVAVQVWTTTFEQPMKFVPMLTRLTGTLPPLHGSYAVGVSKDQLFVHATVLAAGQLKAGA
jgi:hypothetical protein